MKTEYTRFLLPFRSNTRAGLVFMFIAVLALAVALLVSGGLAIAAGIQSRARTEYAKKNLFRAANIVSVSSDEKANPAKIGFYLNGKLAGALLDDGSYLAVPNPPAGGPVALAFANPTETPEPTTVRFPTQDVTVTTNAGSIVICVPAVNAGRVIWSDLKGNTYYDSTLQLRARACKS